MNVSEEALLTLDRVHQQLGDIQSQLAAVSNVCAGGQLAPWSMFLLIAIGGAFGGTVYFLISIWHNRDGSVALLRPNLDPGEAERSNGAHRRVWLEKPSKYLKVWILEAVVGIGGALTVAVVLVISRQLSSCNSSDNLIFLVGVFMLGGLASRRVLMVVSSQLVHQLRQTQQTVLEARQEVEEAINNTEEGKIVAEATERIQALQEHKENVLNSDVQSIISKLEEWRSREPYDRRPTIYIGRLYRWQGRYIYAAESLQDFIEYKRRKDEYDRDYADVLYNRACYFALDYRDSKEPGTKARCLKDLEESIKYSEINARDAVQDSDFSALRDDPEFKRITYSLESQEDEEQP